MNFKDAIRTLKFKKNNGSYHQLYTIWGEKLDTSHVLQEYPRPQLRRKSYVNLNGYWDYTITKEETKPNIYEGKILVPFSPESVLSEANRKLQPGEFLWYERKLNIDKKPLGYRCILHFGAVDQFCEVFINDKKVTEHIGGYLPFCAEFHISLGEVVLSNITPL